MRCRHRFLAFAVCAFLCFAAGTAFAADPPAAKMSAKDVKPLDANALLKNIGARKGAVVVVNIFASWCPPCREEVPGLIAIRKEFPQEQVTILGVSVDKTPKALYNFMDEMEFNYPVFLAEGKFEETVGVTAIPQLLIYNKAGELVTNHKGLVEKAELAKALRTLIAE